MFQHTAARRRLAPTFAAVLPAQCVSTHSRPKAAGANPESRSDVSEGFNTQPPEGGWVCHLILINKNEMFQHTAARRRLVYGWFQDMGKPIVSTHSRPKAAGDKIRCSEFEIVVSTHSRPKAAGTPSRAHRLGKFSFNTQPPEGGWFKYGANRTYSLWFQHTAARRRLGHSHQPMPSIRRFNTQPPEGGWCQHN